MTAFFPLSRLAHTRLFSGRGGAGASSGVGREMRNRLSTTCCGVRTQGARVKTAATVAMRFLLAFCPFVSRSVGCAPGGLTMGIPLAIDSCHQDGAGGGLRRTLPVKSVKVLRCIRQDLLQAAFGDGNAGQVGY